MNCKNCGYPVSKHKVATTTIFESCPRCGAQLDQPVKVTAKQQEGTEGNPRIVRKIVEG